MTAFSKKSMCLLLFLGLILLISIGTAEAYNHAYYMQCCKGCKGLPLPRARALCYAACMAKASPMKR